MASFAIKLIIVLAITPLLGIESSSESEDKNKIKKSKCNDKKGEIFMECGTACPATCDNYNENGGCSMQCVSGCFCPRGTVRRSNDYCIPPEKC